MACFILLALEPGLDLPNNFFGQPHPSAPSTCSPILGSSLACKRLADLAQGGVDQKRLSLALCERASPDASFELIELWADELLDFGEPGWWGGARCNHFRILSGDRRQLKAYYEINHLYH